MQEAAALLKIPVSALEEDLSRLNAEKPRMEDRRSSVAQKEQSSSRAPLSSVAPIPTEEPYPGPESFPPESVTYGAKEIETAPAPANNPPPSLEMALMEFLFGLGPDAQIADMLDAYAPTKLFDRSVTAAFVQAYVRESRGETDAVVNIKKTLPPEDTLVIEDIFFSQNRASISELSPSDNLRKMLSRFWFDAVRRKLLLLPREGDGDLLRRRNKLQMLSRKFKTMPWHVACQSMQPSVLDD
jgi:hypothetical protein